MDEQLELDLLLEEHRKDLKEGNIYSGSVCFSHIEVKSAKSIEALVDVRLEQLRYTLLDSFEEVLSGQATTS